jgi:hypothetical protein
MIFGWLMLASAGVLLQVFESFGNLPGKTICKAIDQGQIAR